MKLSRLKFCCCKVTLIVVLLQITQISFAQNNTLPTETDAATIQASQLNALVDSLSEKIKLRDTFREQFTTAATDDKPDIQGKLDTINSDIKETRLAIEQIAVGTAVLQASVEEPSEFNWRNELNDVFMPLVQNLKRITEKPRKIELLRTKITGSEEQLRNAQTAVENISSALNNSTETITQDTLNQLQTSWTDQADNLKRDINLATIQLENLQRNNTPIHIAIKNGLISFFKGRGLTIILACGAAVLVFFGTKQAAALYAKRQKGEKAHEFRTRQRIIHYGLKTVKTLSILLVVILVFYLRGDILLMTIAFLIAAAIVLSLRHTVPRFLDELKLLLNIGPIREDERVMYHGLPWKVTQLNMYSVLKNPEITGIHRIPIKDLAKLTSRPAGNEPWFPASKNDYILLEHDRLMQVTKLTPEHVILENVAGTETMIPTTDFYNMVFDNLSRSAAFSVVSVFGVSYSHQPDSVAIIPEKIKTAIAQEISNRHLSDNFLNVKAELQEAGSSSLDFWISVQMASEAAVYYPQIKRLIQQACVATCTSEGWDIPFPQLTLHNSTPHIELPV